MTKRTVGQVEKIIARLTKIDPKAPINYNSYILLHEVAGILKALIEGGREKYAITIEKTKEALRPFVDTFPKHREFTIKRWEEQLVIVDANFARVEWELRDGN